MADVKELNINNTTYNIKAKSIVNQNGGSLKYWTGTKSQYDAIATKDANTLYCLTDVGLIYLGETLISNNSNGKNIGELVYSSLPQTDAGLHLMDGSLIQMGIYSEFVEYMAELYGDGTNIPSYFCTESEWQASVTQYGSCGKFVYNNAIYYAWYYENSTTVYTTSITLGDTVTLYSIENGYITNLNKTAEIQERVGFSTITIHDATGWHARNSDKDELIRNVRLPKVSDILQGTTDVNALGDLVVAGLPNIKGTLGAAFNSNPASGAFYSVNEGANQNTSVGGTQNATPRDNWFDASRSSSIYGNSSTVQPQTIKVLYYIVIANSTKTDIQVDIDNIATDLNGKADIDLSNVPTTKGILTESYNNGCSWYRVYADGWCEQGGKLVITSSSVSHDAYNTATLTFLKPFTSCITYNVQAKHDRFNAGFATEITGQALSTVSVYQVNDSSTTSFANPYVIWQAGGYIN